MIDLNAMNDVSGFESKSSWDVAVRFQDLKRFGHIPQKEKQMLKKRAIEGVLNRARRVLGSVMKPEKNMILNFDEFLLKGGRGDLDLLETLDNQSLRFETRVEKETQIALVMDASLSMTGEKIALLAVATAVVALCVPTQRLSLMGFDSRIKWIKRFGDRLTCQQVIESVLELPAGGFTNIELALRETSKMLCQECGNLQANVILIGDGKYTEGGDPARLAAKFKHLHVLKLGRDQAGRDLLLDLTTKGGGQFFEARKIHDLPKTMYAAVRVLLR